MTKDIIKKEAAYSTTDEKNFISKLGTFFFDKKTDKEQITKKELLTRYNRALAKREKWDEIDSHEAIHAVKNAILNENAK